MKHCTVNRNQSVSDMKAWKKEFADPGPKGLPDLYFSLKIQLF